jgi:DNA polymerase III alpha subunit (gram-positive type)
MTSKTWDVMNDLEMVTSKIVSAREIIDASVEALQRHEYSKAETLSMAAYEFLGYYLNEFDEKFKLAWKETVGQPTSSTKVCDVNDNSEECKTYWNDFWNDYQEPTIQDKKYMTQYHIDPKGNVVPVDKVIKWQLPVEMDGPSGEYFVSFPDDLLEAANLKEGDNVEWIDNENGTWTLKKVEN